MNSRRLPQSASFLAALALIASISTEAWALGKKKPAPESVAPHRPGKLVIALAPVERARIEMPDETIHDFGKDLEASLITRFTQGEKFIVADEKIRPFSQALSTARTAQAEEDFEWTASATPSATIRISVDALSFQTGSRGERMFYGFNERFRTPFNDGSLDRRNEYPLREVLFEPNWFERTFDVKGTAPFDSTAGLDLGEGLSINLLFAWVTLKYAFYRSDLHLRVVVDAPLLGKRDEKLIHVSGKGYFYDLSAAYSQFSAAIRLARKDAMDQAMKKALAGSLESIEKSVAGYPLLAKIDALTADEHVLLGTGPNAGVKAGTLYEVREIPGVVVQIVSSNATGAIGKVIQGKFSHLKPSLLLQQVNELPPPPIAPLAESETSEGEGFVKVSLDRGVASRGAVESLASASIASTRENLMITLPDSNLERANLGELEPETNWIAAWWKSFTDTILLVYRINRYFSYDQKYNAGADGMVIEGPSDEGFPLPPISSLDGWHAAAANSDWGKQIGLDQVFRESDVRVKSEKERHGPIVAIIDSGVDYNHPVIHPSLWLNPSPVEDAYGKDRYGWDFVSNDSRPFDDGYHGTQMASAVLSVAPQALILPIKAFNPFGVTSSAMLYESFRYAVDRGAQVILCGWATRRSSHALEMGIAYARERGVLVVAAAGDRGDDLSKMPAYPASLAKTHDNVLTVAGVDRQDHLVRVQQRFSSFDPSVVRLAAPGLAIRVAEPRRGDAIETSSGIAAALVAGAAARDKYPNYIRIIEKLETDADSVSGLDSAVRGGLRLRLR